jgi:O-antigen/teichoic acid export membrane protein
MERGNGDSARGAAVDYGKTAGFLSIGVGLTGLITYAYFFIASHQLSKPDYGEIAVLWSAVFITVSTLYRPIDQLLSRHVSENLARGEPVGGPMRVAAKIQLALAVGFAVIALALKGPIEDGLLDGNTTLYWIGFGAVLGYAASYYARGYLAGRRRFGLFSVLILTESIFRTSFAVFVAVGLLSGQSAVAIGIVAAPLLSLVVVPLAFTRHEEPETTPAVAPSEAGAENEKKDERSAPAFSLAHGTGFAAAVLMIMLAEQTFLNAGPLLIGATEGAAAAGFIFNVLMIARAPLQLFQAVGTSLLPHLTALHHTEGGESKAAFHHSVRLVLAGIAVFTAAVALALAVAGPELMQLAWSDKFTYPREDLLIVTAGMGLYLAAVGINAAVLAQGQVRRSALRWIACTVLFVAWILVPLVDDVFLRTEVGFTAAAGVLCALLYRLYARPIEVPADVPESGTPEELETRLAAADELS